MGEDGVAGPPAKKRGATRQISKEDGSDSEGDAFANLESGTFQKASEQVIAGRRIVKLRRSGASAVGPPAPNPFASIRLEAPMTAPNPFASISLVAPAAITTTSSAPDAVQEDKPVVSDATADRGNDKSTGENVIQVDKQVLEDPKAVRNEILDLKSQGDHTDPVKPISGDVQDEILDLKSEGEHLESVRAISGNGKGWTETTVETENGEGEEQAVHKGDQVGKEDEGNLDDEGKDKDKVEVGEDGSVERGISKDSCLPLGSTNHGSFSFGTTSSAFETPTGFASFSSTWAAFGSNNTSETGLGSGFAWNKAASTEEDSGLVSTVFGNSSNPSSFQLFSTHPSTTPLTTAPSSNPPPTSILFVGGSTQTGEEQEKVVFGADATLFEFVEGSWKERGKGELRVNAPIGNGSNSRLLMRSRGNFRLIMNASIFPDMKMTGMDSRGVTFACANSAVEERDGLATYAVKFKDSLSAGNFREAVEAQRHLPAQGGLKTPENSPSAVHGA